MSEEQATATATATAFATAFMEALPESISKVKTKMEEAQAQGKIIPQEHFAALDMLTDVKNGFCRLWPEANRDLDAAEWWIGIVKPNVVAIMDAAEAAINKMVYQPLCLGTPTPPTPSTQPSQPKVKKNFGP